MDAAIKEIEDHLATERRNLEREPTSLFIQGLIEAYEASLNVMRKYKTLN